MASVNHTAIPVNSDRRPEFFPYSVFACAVDGRTVHYGYADREQAEAVYHHFCRLPETLYSTLFGWYSAGRSVELAHHLAAGAVVG